MILRLCLFIIVILANFNVISFKYISDDKTILTLNNATQKGFNGIYEILSTPRLFGFQNSNDGTYRPIPLITHAIEFEFFGFNPAISHFINLILYSLIVVLFFEIINIFIKSNSISFLASLLFAFHPIHLEIVSTIKTRDDLLAGIFSLLFFYSILKDKKSIYSIILLSLAFLSKESTIMLIFIPIFYKKDYSIKYFLNVLILYIFHYFITLNNKNITGSFIDNPLINQSFFSRIFSSLEILNLYFKNLIFYNFRSDYSYPVAHITEQFRFSLLIGLILVILGVLSKERKHFIMFILFILPTLNLFFTSGVYYADRLIFLGSIFATIYIISSISSINFRINYLLIIFTFFNLVPYFEKQQCWSSEREMAKCVEENQIKSWKDLNLIGTVAILDKDYKKCSFYLGKALNLSYHPIVENNLKKCISN